MAWALALLAWAACVCSSGAGSGASDVTTATGSQRSTSTAHDQGQAQDQPPHLGVDFQVSWPQFLARSDLTSAWTRTTGPNRSGWVSPGPPFSYDTAGFLGNGNLGVLVQADGNGSITLVLGRTDVYDRRVPGSPFATGELLCDVAKLPIGNLTLRAVGRVLDGEMRVRLWDGEATVNLTTSLGKISTRITVFGGSSAPSGGSSGIVVVSNDEASGGESAAVWRFTAADANANLPHPVYSTESYSCTNKHYKSNPPAVLSTTADGIRTSEQALLVGPRYATAFAAAAGVTVLATTGPLPGSTALSRATADARWALHQARRDALFLEHYAAWHEFYTSGSFVSVSHPRLEQFYWITQYKLGCGMGLRGDLAGDGGAMDHTSPWFLPNNGLFNWDLNIQMTWWGVAGADRVSLVLPLLRFLERNTPDFCANVVAAAQGPHSCDCTTDNCTFRTLAGPSAHTGYVAVGRIETGHHNPGDQNKSIVPPGPLGDLVWALTNIEHAWRVTRNRSIAERLYPLVSGAANYYIHWLAKETPWSGPADGFYHLPPTFSPEYLGGPGDGDTSYELALCRWGLATSLELGIVLGIHDPRAAAWQDRLDNLAPYSASSTGLDVARNLPFDQPHRHFSHLLGVVLKDPTLHTPASSPLVQLSIAHWRSLRDPCTLAARPASRDAGWVGFSYAASALLNARLQNTEAAVTDLTWYVERSAVEGKFGHRESPVPISGACPLATEQNGSGFFANTFYGEGLGDPTAETPFGTCAALQEVLVGTSAVDEVLSVFPGLGNGTASTSLSTMCFHQLRVVGAFLVSACFANGRTTFASLHSEAGARCRVELPSMQQPLSVLPSTVPMNISAGGVVELELKPGESVTVYSTGTQPDLAIRAVPMAPYQENFWGFKNSTHIRNQ